jgi:hypothetical protein
MSPVNFSAVDTRTVTGPLPLGDIDVEQLGKTLAEAGQDGYSITSIVTLGGGQRDEPPTSWRIVLSKR